MSHEMTMRENGKAAALYARRAAWHRLGDVAVEEFTARAALEATGLDFGVDTAPVFATINGVQVPTSHKATFANIDGKVQILGVVGEDYVPINPNELFGFMDDVIGQVDGAHYSAAFALRKWTQVVCVADTGSMNLDPDGRNDEIKKYLIGRTSHDGSLAFGIKWSNMRVECANMLAMHLREKAVEWKTRHTVNVRDRVSQAKVTLGMYREYEDEWALAATNMIRAEIKQTEFDKWLDGLMVAVKDQNKDDEIDREAAFTIRGLYEASPTATSIRGTVWGALQAATEYSDWVVESRGGKKTTEDEARVLRQIGDTNPRYGQGFKQTAWELSAEMVREQMEARKIKVPRKAKVG